MSERHSVMVVAPAGTITIDEHGDGSGRIHVVAARRDITLDLERMQMAALRLFFRGSTCSSEIRDLRADAERDNTPFIAHWKARAEKAEAAIERVRRALDDELANLADDGARLSHSVVRRIEAALSDPHC